MTNKITLLVATISFIRTLIIEQSLHALNPRSSFGIDPRDIVKGMVSHAH